MKHIKYVIAVQHANEIMCRAFELQFNLNALKAWAHVKVAKTNAFLLELYI